jgi:hypothetical protein
MGVTSFNSYMLFQLPNQVSWTVDSSCLLFGSAVFQVPQILLVVHLIINHFALG